MDSDRTSCFFVRPGKLGSPHADVSVRFGSVRLSRETGATQERRPNVSVGVPELPFPLCSADAEHCTLFWGCVFVAHISRQALFSGANHRPVPLICFAGVVCAYFFAVFQEMLGNPAKARAIFERWMEWEPEDNAWSAYVKFEMRQEEPAKAR